MIFYIAFVLGSFALHRALKFPQDDLIGFVEQVGQNIEATPVSHADDHLIDIQYPPGFYQSLQQRQQSFAPFYGEALLADVAGVEKLLKLFSLDQLPENPMALFPGKFGPIVNRFNFLFQPGALSFVGNGHEIDAQSATIGSP